MVHQNYHNLIEMTSNIIDIVAFGVGFKCPRKIHLNTQCRGGGSKNDKIPFLGYLRTLSLKFQEATRATQAVKIKFELDFSIGAVK